MSKSNSNDDAGAVIAGVVSFGVVIMLVYWVLLFLANGLAFITSTIGLWIGKLGEWPMTFLKIIGIQTTNFEKYFALSQALGWFSFFLITGTITSVLIAHVLLPSKTPNKAYDEPSVFKVLMLKSTTCIALFFCFLFILWKY